jgi:hypothetical protein
MHPNTTPSVPAVIMYIICGSDRPSVTASQLIRPDLALRLSDSQRRNHKISDMKWTNGYPCRTASNLPSILAFDLWKLTALRPAPAPLLRQTSAHYWLSGLKTRMPASVLEQTPTGSTRTTASSSAQKPRMPVWLIVFGTDFTV